MITDKVIEQYPYDKNSETAWATRYLREYLNGNFYDSFNEDERAQIIAVTNENLANQYYGTESDPDTEDRIFALSIDEVVKYMGSGEFGNVNDIGHIGDQYNSERKALTGEGGGESLYLRSLGASEQSVAIINANGSIFVSGHRIINIYQVGIRSAMWLKID